MLPQKDWISELCVPLRQKFGDREANNLQRCLKQDLSLKIDQPDKLQKDKLHRSVELLLSGVPLAYVTGVSYFYGLTLQVDPNVLIPRPETEELAQLIKQHYNNINPKPTAFLDMGTGSGCIAIALAKIFPESKAYAVDISKNALDVAGINAKNNNCKIETIQADILNRQQWDRLPIDIPLIVSNPPYIPKNEMHLMDEQVVKHEPSIALFTEDDDGQSFYKAISEFALYRGSKDVNLFFELNEFNSRKTEKWLKGNGFEVTIYNDMQGKERMLHARRCN